MLSHQLPCIEKYTTYFASGRISTAFRSADPHRSSRRSPASGGAMRRPYRCCPTSCPVSRSTRRTSLPEEFPPPSDRQIPTVHPVGHQRLGVQCVGHIDAVPPVALYREVHDVLRFRKNFHRLPIGRSPPFIP